VGLAGAACGVQRLAAAVNAAAAITLAAALMALFVGVLSRRIALAPGSGEQRWFAVVVLASAAYGLCNLSSSIPASAPVVVLLAGVELALVAVLVWGWIRFSQAFAGVTPGRAERLGCRALLFGAPFLATPGLLFSGAAQDRPFSLLGVVYRQACTTPTGELVFAVLSAIGAAVLVRLVVAWRRGVRFAAAVALAYATMLACAVSDALTVVWKLPLPLLLAWGFTAPVLALTWINATRLVELARALDRLRGELVSQVDARTRALTSTLESLHQAEQLAYLGRFAKGLAHEVNNPAAVVTSSLSFISTGGPLAGEAAEALADARAGMERIRTLVRKLVDAARVAAPPGAAVADAPRVIAKVVEHQPPLVRAGLRVDTGAAPDACVRLLPDALEQVVETLVSNAVDAAAPGAPHQIEIRAERSDGRVRITVTDQGRGMSPEVLRRAFEPFFTTKPEGHGSGLGLAVAQGLVRASGGSISLESEPGHGTRATVDSRRRSRRWGERASSPERRGGAAGQSLARSMRTRARPRRTIPSWRAAARERSTTRPGAKGPRSFTVTTTDRPVSRSVTRRRVPKGARGCAQVNACWS
jgi:signal transduction histidine kinase